MKTKDWTYDGDYVTTVESHSQRGKFYDIKRTKGVLTCECSSYKFSKAPKTCRHLAAVTAGDHRLIVDAETEHVRVGAETFTLRRRRGLSFDGKI